MEKKKLFCTRYSFQAAIHVVWRERNKINHGDQSLPLLTLKKMVEKGVRNKLSLMRGKGGKRMEGTLQFWFATMLWIFFQFWVLWVNIAGWIDLFYSIDHTHSDVNMFFLKIKFNIRSRKKITNYATGSLFSNT